MGAAFCWLFCFCGKKAFADAGRRDSLGDLVETENVKRRSEESTFLDMLDFSSSTTVGDVSGLVVFELKGQQ